MTSPELENPLEELGRENEVARRLTERLAGYPAEIRGGGRVPSGEVAEGVRLLGQYAAVHGRRFAEVLLPEAKPVAMSTCFEHLDHVVAEHHQRGDQVQAVEALLARSPAAAPDPALAPALETLTQAQHDALQYEDDYPLSCLVPTLPDDAVERVRAGFQPTSGELVELEAHIDRFLARTPGASEGLSVHCAEPGCTASGTASIVAGAEGRIGLRAPLGWSLQPGRPQRVAGDRIHTEVAAKCPLHRAPAAPATSDAAPCCGPVSDCGA